MPRPKSNLDVQTAVRIPRDWVDRAEALKEAIAPLGLHVTRSDVLRTAIERGLRSLEREQAARSRAGAVVYTDESKEGFSAAFEVKKEKP